MNRLKDGFAFSWTKHHIIMPFLMGWLLATLSVLFVRPTHVAQVGLLIFAIVFIIHRVNKWSEARIAQMYVDFKESGQYDELKEILMEEANKMAKQFKQRKLMTYCNECECQIFENDSYYVDGPGDTYCIVCCDDIEKKAAENKKDCMCWTCGRKFSMYKSANDVDIITTCEECYSRPLRPAK